MSPRAAVAEAESALAEAEVPVRGVRVLEAGQAEDHRIAAVVTGGELLLTMDADSGRFTRIEVSDGADVSDRQIEALARHEGNPGADDSDGTRALVALAALLAVGFGGFALARRARIRSES